MKPTFTLLTILLLAPVNALLTATPLSNFTNHVHLETWVEHWTEIFSPDQDCTVRNGNVSCVRTHYS